MSEGVTRSKDGVPQWSGDASLFQAYEEEALQCVPETVLVRPSTHLRVVGDCQKVCGGQTPRLGELQRWGAAADDSSSRVFGKTANSRVIRPVDEVLPSEPATPV